VSGDKTTSMTTWALIGGTVIGAAGWVTTTIKDNRNAGSTIVTAATELVDRLTAEQERLRSMVDECERKHAVTEAKLLQLQHEMEMMTWTMHQQKSD